MLFYQPLNGYCYNSDSIFLFDFIRRYVKKGSLLDVGAGCGIIGLLLANELKIELDMVELQEEMGFFAKKNSEINGIECRVFCEDFLSFKPSKKYDYVVSNPPFYHASTVKSQNAFIGTARHTDSLPFDSMLKKINSLIAPKGEFIFCYESRALAFVLKTLLEYKFGVERLEFLHPKIEKNSTIFFCRAKKGSKSQLTINPPFVVFDDKGYTKKAQDIYDSLRTHTLKCEIDTVKQGIYQ